MEIASTPGFGQSPIASTAADGAAVLSSDFETFLKMLTVQMQNQDPLDPVKSEDFAVQLATFSSVEQQVLTNDLLQAMTAQMNVSGIAQFAGWVGMEGRAPVAGSFTGTPLTISPDPLRTADSAMLVVHDTNGIEVQRLAIPISSEPFQWTGIGTDGTALPHGTYKFSVESYSNGALAQSVPAEVYTRIIEARNTGGQIVLVTESGDEVPASAVTGLREPAGIV